MLLNHDELMLVASLLGQNSVIGLTDIDRAADATPSLAQRERAAAQSLLARQLASLGPNGSPRIDRRIISAVRTCAYPQRVLIAQQSTETQQHHISLVYLTASASVMLRVVAPGKYRLTLYNKPSNALITFEQQWLSDKITSPSPNIALVVNDQVLLAVRDSVLNRDVQSAQQTLSQAGVNPIAANALTYFLGKPHSFIALQGIQLANEHMSVRSASVLQNGTSAWLLVEPPDSAPTAHHCALSTVSSAGLHQFIQRLVSL
ncbi:MAG: hypothetical protein KIH69_016740 [Anaerolineae bacterium]|nr:hypothetical protein [Anaerolineae bacterium]